MAITAVNSAYYMNMRKIVPIGIKEIHHYDDAVEHRNNGHTAWLCAKITYSSIRQTKTKAPP